MDVVRKVSNTERFTVFQSCGNIIPKGDNSILITTVSRILLELHWRNIELSMAASIHGPYIRRHEDHMNEFLFPENSVTGPKHECGKYQEDI
jgi:hypothetical protein